MRVLSIATRSHFFSSSVFLNNRILKYVNFEFCNFEKLQLLKNYLNLFKSAKFIKIIFYILSKNGGRNFNRNDN